MVFRLHTPYLSHVGARHRDEAVRSHAALQAAAAIMRNIREEKGAEERWSRKTESKTLKKWMVDFSFARAARVSIFASG